MSKSTYFKNSILRRFTKNLCPACGSSKKYIIDSKLFGLTNLLECQACSLRYRFPSDSEVFNYQYYQDSYVQPGLTTDLPAMDELAILMRTKFANTEKDFSVFNSILELASHHLQRTINILDYGANWGYACYQFKQLPFVHDAYAFELSQPRRAYGERNLAINYVNDPHELGASIDVVFSSHVIEHMSNPAQLKEFADIVLKPDGIIILTCPNGSDSARLKNLSWSKLWGEVHPNYISDRFLLNLFADYNGIVGGEEMLNAAIELNSLFSVGMLSNLPSSSNLVCLAKKQSSS
jgi:SAM-dependent methyltransferase